jgi:hypothetical protein
MVEIIVAEVCWWLGGSMHSKELIKEGIESVFHVKIFRSKTIN